MINLHALYTFIDLTGTFAFAVSGAVAARDKGLDIFGILVVSFTVACGGGIIRDLCIGAIPPAGLSDWRYLTRREDSVWYPTMRLFRQDRPGDWQSVFTRMAAALER